MVLIFRSHVCKVNVGKHMVNTESIGSPLLVLRHEIWHHAGVYVMIPLSYDLGEFYHNPPAKLPNDKFRFGILHDIHWFHLLFKPPDSWNRNTAVHHGCGRCDSRSFWAKAHLWEIDVSFQELTYPIQSRLGRWVSLVSFSIDGIN